MKALKKKINLYKETEKSQVVGKWRAVLYTSPPRQKRCPNGETSGNQERRGKI